MIERINIVPFEMKYLNNYLFLSGDCFRCQMCMETYPGSLKNKSGYVVYDMYFNA